MSIQVSAPAATADTATAGLPIVNQALEPAWVRHGSASTQKAYESALAFEQSLVEELAKSLADTSGLSGEGSPVGGEAGAEGSSAGTSQLTSMLPQSLTSSVMDAGGIGLAAQMTRQLEGAQAPASAKASGGTSAA
jgi:Rod binding domain-containing protein